ncbi:MAG: NRAMP family divalent metal transporter [Terriglobales bacterium]
MPVTIERRRTRQIRRMRPHLPGHPPGTSIRALGLGIITGAANDDPSAVGTFASAGARFGTAVLWLAPAIYPMMAVVVYLAAKLGQVTGQGFAAALKGWLPRWLLWTIVLAILAGNTVEAAADLGGIAAGLQLLVPFPLIALILPQAAAILALQVFGSYVHIRGTLRWLALTMLAYIGAALFAHPDIPAIARATVVPHLRFSREYLLILLAVIGASLSPYLYIWQASQEVEEDISMGRRRLSDRQGTTAAALHATAWDVLTGLFFAAVVMYFILLAAAVTLFPAHVGELTSAAQAARALAPLAGQAAGVLFAAGIIGVGCLAVPVMTVGAAYVLCEARGWKSGLSARPREAPQFYATIAAVTAIATAGNFFGINPMRFLVAAGAVQGVLAPVLILLLLALTNRRALMGSWTNTRTVNALGLAAFGLTAAAAVAAALA